MLESRKGTGLWARIQDLRSKFEGLESRAWRYAHAMRSPEVRIAEFLIFVSQHRFSLQPILPTTTGAASPPLGSRSSAAAAAAAAATAAAAGRLHRDCCAVFHPPTATAAAAPRVTHDSCSRPLVFLLPLLH